MPTNEAFDAPDHVPKTWPSDSPERAASGSDQRAPIRNMIVITTPIFLPILMPLGVDPVHFGIIMMLNLGIGLVTPPVGSVLFVSSAVGGITVERAVRTIWPFYGALLVALLLVSFVPALSLALPRFFG